MEKDKRKLYDYTKENELVVFQVLSNSHEDLRYRLIRAVDNNKEMFGGAIPKPVPGGIQDTIARDFIDLYGVYDNYAIIRRCNGPENRYFRANWKEDSSGNLKFENVVEGTIEVKFIPNK